MQKLSLTLLRVSLGWLFFYAGIIKVFDPSWSAAGYLAGAKTFTAFYHWFASPQIIPITNFLNVWGLTLIGASLILGIAVRPSALLGAVMMLLYYFPGLSFPHPNANTYIVDEHIIYAAALLLLAATRAGRTWGLGKYCANWPLCSRYPKLHNFFD